MALKDDIQKIGTEYWTSGFYDSGTSQWLWAKNRQSMPPLPPWGVGFPSGTDSDLRIYLFHTNRYTAFWRTVIDTELIRYICEVNVLQCNYCILDNNQFFHRFLRPI